MFTNPTILDYLADSRRAAVPRGKPAAGLGSAESSMALIRHALRALLHRPPCRQVPAA